MKCVEETGTFFEPTLATLFVREAFSPSTQSAVCEGSFPAHIPPPLPTQSFSPNSIDCALLDGLDSRGVRQSEREREREGHYGREVEGGQAASLGFA